MGFIDEVMPYAQMVAEKTGLDPSWITAQWHLETGGVIPTNKNLGGIQTGYASYSKYGSPGGLYMSYPSVEFFARDYANFINGKSYREAGVFESQSVEDFFTALKVGGYAEDPKYITKGISRYNSIFPGGYTSSTISANTGALRDNDVLFQGYDIESLSTAGYLKAMAKLWGQGKFKEADQLKQLYSQEGKTGTAKTMGGIDKADDIIKDTLSDHSIIKIEVFIILFVFIGFAVLMLIPSNK